MTQKQLMEVIGMQYKAIITRIVLIGSIVLSIILSWFIWTGSTNMPSINQPKQTTTTKKSDTTQPDLTDVFAPTQLLYQDEKDKYLLYNSHENIINEIGSLLKKANANSFIYAHLSEKKYLAQINKTNALTLKYSDQVSYQLFAQSYNQKPKRLKLGKNISFNRAQIVFGTQQTSLWLLNDQTKIVYHTKLTNFKETQVLALLNKADLRLSVSEQLFNHEPTVYIKPGQKLRPYSYLVNQQPENYYIAGLLNKDSNKIDMRQQSDGVVYSTKEAANQQKRLTVMDDTGELAFQDYNNKALPTELSERFEMSYQLLANIGNSLSSMRYYQYSGSDAAITFRMFVEGFPIFYQTNFGSVKVQLMASGQRVEFSSYGLQVPVPTDQKKVDILGTQQVIDQLTNRGYKQSAISKIQLGYQWQQEASNNQVIDLTPTYFIEYNGNWYALNELMTKNYQDVEEE